LVADIVGVFGGFIVSVYRLNFNASNYISQSWEYLEISDVTSGLWKAATFGLIIALMGCYNGFNSKGGAQGVGTATTNAVVSASILILVTNYILTGILFAAN
jgi:phospholipid/cholesterol/gamma-HCH transport system permease protein